MFGILRTLLAINVVLLHIFNVPTLGNYSVSFFFVLSGFLMTYIMHHTYGYSVKGFKVFWLNRFLRLYPIYWVVLIFTILGITFFKNYLTEIDIYMPSSFKEWFYNVTIIFPNIVPHRVEPRLVSSAWALTNELIFYMLISLGLSRTKRTTILWLIASIAYYIFTYLFYNIPTFRYSSILASSLPFALGSFLYWLKDYKIIKKGNALFALFFYLLFVLNALYLRNNSLFFNELSIYINLIIASSLVYILFNLKIPMKLKQIDNYIGRYSYPFYLAHFLVLIVYAHFFEIGILDGTFKLSFDAVYFYGIELVLFCFILVHFIDMPIDKLKNSIKKKAKNN